MEFNILRCLIYININRLTVIICLSTRSIICGLKIISFRGSLNFIWISIACIIAGPITQAIGRKRAMQLITIPYMISWILFYFSATSWHIFLALSITGCAGGLLEAPVSIFLYINSIKHILLLSYLSITKGKLRNRA